MEEEEGGGGGEKKKKSSGAKARMLECAEPGAAGARVHTLRKRQGKGKPERSLQVGRNTKAQAYTARRQAGRQVGR